MREAHKLCAPAMKMTLSAKGAVSSESYSKDIAVASAEQLLSRKIYDPAYTVKWETWHLLSSSENQSFVHSKEILLLFILRENFLYLNAP